jgi:hypothetical protein
MSVDPASVYWVCGISWFVGSAVYFSMEMWKKHRTR